MPDAPAPRAEALAMFPCPTCGADVIMGQTDQGATLPVELRTQVYTLVWDRGAPWPRLAQSRGYVAHQCGEQG